MVTNNGIPIDQLKFQTDVEDTIELEFSPEYILDQLAIIIPSDFITTLTEVTPDVTVLSHNRKDMNIACKVKRWQGTGTQLTFSTSVKIEKQIRRKGNVMDWALFIMSGILLMIIMSELLPNILPQVPSFITYTVFFIVFLLLGWVGWSSNNVYVEEVDYNKDKRWQAQKDMAHILEQIYALKDKKERS